MQLIKISDMAHSKTWRLNKLPYSLKSKIRVFSLINMGETMFHLAFEYGLGQGGLCCGEGYASRENAGEIVW